MTPRRPLRVAMVFTAVAVAVPCAAWYVAGSRAAEREAARIAEAPLRTAGDTAARLALRLAARLETLREIEAGRPPSHYQHYFHDPAAACECAVLQTSPLATGPADPLVLAHFQVDSECRVSFPDADEEERVANAREGELLELLQAEAPAPTVDPRLAGAADSGPERPLLMGPFRWRTIGEGDRRLLAAVREVTTTWGPYLQGFVISPEEAGALIQGSPFPATLVPGDPEGPGDVPLDLDDARWTLRVDAGEAAASAADEAAQVRRRFRGTFLAGAAAALLAALSVLAVVWQTERLAGQRVQFAAAAAHELRTPLAGLRLHGEMIAEGLGDEGRTRDYARRMADEAERLGRVVGNVMGYTHLERGGLSVARREGDLGAAVRACVERLEPALRAQGATVDLVVADDVPRMAFDPDALDQILQNLVDNAAKYAVGAVDRTIHVSLAGAPGGAALTVRDHGPGIPSSVRRHLFRPFVRGQNGGEVAGLGLGLAVVRGLTEAHGGTLALEDAPGGGTSVTVRLPA